ncbi:MAG: outer membrane protein assembly factor BamD [Rhodobacter sp.]|uniref:outer membrane protein assembly factor BamD n=1 Tax=Pararhodobacter sp. TaxID=2127056 RepID=UPI001D57F143|nr:outer membrane protein assembly factor BamD [Pararhodobacter sp.]MCB1345570.1 outer membrane protein assembly factor BamD [Paracoccaceae bacterium]MCC0074550.1 outer membrane protein assembly factor BamD [Rhodobacter sp.]HPD91770.1 outer membrane protein assembly factor BamD [Pararhodobacter sp.]
MSGIGRKLAVLAMSGAVVLSLAACNRNNADGESLDGYTAEQIFQRGEYVLENSRRAEDSLHYFREVERLYPYTDWARRSIVMQAYALHREGKYDEARAAAQRFLDQYPGDPDAAWAAYIVALTYYDQIEDVGRDQGLTFQALQHLRYVIETYPNTEYARSAVLKFDLAFDRLAAKEMEIGRYYLARRNYAAAINRFRAVVEQYQTTTQTPEALHRLVECYLALGLRDEAQTAGAILGHNFRSSPFYEDSYRLLTDAGLTTDAAGESWIREVYRRTVRGEWL